MPGARTGCGKLPESLQRKAAPSLFYPFSGDLIIFSNSQDGILYPLFPHLFLPSSCLCSFPFTSLCHFVLKPISNSELAKSANGCPFWAKYKTLAFYSGKVPLLNYFRTIIIFVGLLPEHIPWDVYSYGSRDSFLLCPRCVYFIQIIRISHLTFCSRLLQAVVLRWGTP